MLNWRRLLLIAINLILEIPAAAITISLVLEKNSYLYFYDYSYFTSNTFLLTIIFALFFYVASAYLFTTMYFALYHDFTKISYIVTRTILYIIHCFLFFFMYSHGGGLKVLQIMAAGIPIIILSSLISVLLVSFTLIPFTAPDQQLKERKDSEQAPRGKHNERDGDGSCSG
ncbi:hypothetical protein [Asticcacaulis sp.]|uniref:hypothetical protein n=1 Tax=Asticcacaulis sp. TaxID=1872648 RepID=UPI00262BACF7|nr:hypothetical protein [Asticcacaulis sp.]